MNEQKLDLVKIKKRITINDFIGNQIILLCDTGHITNGHWILTQKSFKNKLNYILVAIKEKKPFPLKKQLNTMKNQEFIEVFLTEEKDDCVICESKDKALKIGFKLNYFIWLTKNISDIRFFASSSEGPCSIRQGILQVEIGFLMPWRIS